jgi:hypothetical protein
LFLRKVGLPSTIRAFLMRKSQLIEQLFPLIDTAVAKLAVPAGEVRAVFTMVKTFLYHFSRNVFTTVLGP